ncbi:uncharacterized protein LOC126886857 [Diabrotica virgifera virgifera]|uniref:Reverse transcriptase domain-containing protein n=4 Tax=Diabrotica virgifera virgifera TaxID=50390 RepID=A0ABM5KI86_DIAVI|nr:uncharacterized protein LOC126879506 [Diabrotica virgifera virgifera]XP_050507619.1 uncharacterized protein LOC126885210 [Diabrotica virgifera virgifera]XP_050509911.1 uncharacterized protein LOC126886854 isoform X1 [Diabrotica virgifera virgifera]XP_050509912.1 uncharacterized protein LOC126886854 isoform X2 [Diabrotica virgifera virgifera]XP_050509913.1 uncharacterized protein LOC126886856 [Diabrotica virgifera virgifera]XP_050509914.1 uncharacterized protein LOC126886857 [Diabrotica virg
MVVDFSKYLRLSKKRELLNIDIWFIHKCIKFKVTPTFAKCKVPSTATLNFKSQIERKFLQKELCKHHAHLDKINVQLKILYDNIVREVPFDNFRDSIANHLDNLEYIKQSKFNRVNNKLHNLIKKKNNLNSNSQNTNRLMGSFKFRFHKRTVNLSTCSFTNKELDFLSNGLKFSTLVPFNNKMVEEFSVDIDTVIESLPLDNISKTNLKSNCFLSLQKDLIKFNNNVNNIKTKCFKQLHLIRQLSFKLKSNNLIITKADKGNCLIIMHHSDYVQKTEEFLRNNNFDILDRNPLNKLITNLKNTLSKHKDFLQLHKTKEKTFILSNPQIPRLYGLPKIHKPNVPMRPVVSFYNTPVVTLSKFINSILQSTITLQPSYSVKNSTDLVNKLSVLNLPRDFFLVSFDVSNLFTNVPRDETIPLVEDLLIKSNINRVSIPHLLDLLKFCLSQDFFTFNDIIYRQAQGLAMGNPLSPLLADLFLNNLEVNIFDNNSSNQNSFQKILYWFRYVDDVLAIIDGNSTDAENILYLLNNLHPAINFTLETESNKSINFLDLTLTRMDSKLIFSVFRKPTQTDHTIPRSSNHPFQQKMASFYCYIHRLLSLPLSDTNFNSELDIIKQLAYSNGYSPTLVDNILNKLRSKRNRSLAYNPVLNNSTTAVMYRSISYIGYPSDNIAKILNNIPNLKLSFKCKENIKSIFSHTKDKIGKTSKSGIYKLSCGDCPVTYVGRTMRPLETRIKEHLSKIDKSSFGNHLHASKHNFSPQRDSRILHSIPINNYTKMNLLEDLEISRELKRNPQNCVNTQVQLNCKFDPIFKKFL